MNRHNPHNHRCSSTLPQIARYTCGSLAVANVLQRALSQRCALHPPSQVNRHNPHNHRCFRAFLQNVRYTCGRLRSAMRTTSVDLGTNRLLLSMSQSGRVGFASGLLRILLISKVLQFYMYVTPPRKHARRPELRGTLHSGKSSTRWLLGGYKSDYMQSVLREALSQGVGCTRTATTPVIRHIPGGVERETWRNAVRAIAMLRFGTSYMAFRVM